MVQGSKILVMAALFAIPATGFTQTPSQQAIKAKLVEIAGRHCTQAKQIIQQGDAAQVAFYMDGKMTEPLSLTNFETVVHEMLHGLDHRIGVGKWENGRPPNGYFVEKGVEVVVPFQKTFHTADLHAEYFPAEVRRLFRYDTYIFDVEEAMGPRQQSDVTTLRPLVAGESTTTANVEGIFGLLEEFNAYYHGALAEYEIIKSGIEYDHFGSTHLVTAAYYEFNIFMAYFLKYAEEMKPAVYKDLMANKQLRTAYTLIETNWRNLLTKIYEDKEMAEKFPGSEGEFELFSNELRAVMADFMLSEQQLPQYAGFFKSKAYRPELISANRKDDIWGGDDEESVLDDLDEFELNGRMVVPKERGYFYVVIESPPSAKQALNSYMRVVSNHAKAHIYTDAGKFHVYLDRFTSKSQADSMVQRLLRTYPGIKVM